MTPITKPERLDLRGAAVSVRIMPAGLEWELRVVLFRRGQAVPLAADDVEVELRDAGGAMMQVLSRPAGALVETGNASSTTTNADFRVRAPVLPARLWVRWGGAAGQFDVM